MEGNRNGGLLQSLLFSGGGSGGSTEPFVVTVTQTTQTAGTMDKTPQEIYEAYMANKRIVTTINTFPGNYIYPVGILTVENTASFQCVFFYQQSGAYILYTMASYNDSQVVDVTAFQLTTIGS